MDGLWIGPLLLLVSAAIGFGRFLKEQAESPAEFGSTAFTRLEQNQLDKILKRGSSQ